MNPCIYIQGCARSGNTLIRELIVNGFQHTELHRSATELIECGPDGLLAATEARSSKEPDLVLVASRDINASKNMDRDIVLNNPHMHILWMIRNPLDLLSSKHPDDPSGYYVKPRRYISSLEMYLSFKDLEQVFTVRYEDLVQQPSEVQRQIADRFSLDVQRAFEECHPHFNQSDQTKNALLGIRPIDTESINKWQRDPKIKENLQRILKKHPKIIEIASELNYPVDQSLL